MRRRETQQSIKPASAGPSCASTQKVTPPGLAYKLIPLTQGKFAIVDSADFEWLNQWKWFVHKSQSRYYAARRIRRPDGKQISLPMHRQILDAHCGQQVDHQNHVTLDNRRFNIRICTNRQNSQNRKNRPHSSNFKSVDWHKWHKKWRARIVVNGKDIHLGYFNKEKEAGFAYDQAAERYFGEFAQTNF